MVWVITADDFNSGNVVNLWQLIEGKAPGLLINHAGGKPGGPASVMLGHGDMPSSQITPLIVLNGVPLFFRSHAGLRNTLNFIDPGTIESVTLLKEGSASAIYGSEGGLGVIQINTKKPLKNSPLRLFYSSNASVGTPTRLPEVADGELFRTLLTRYYGNNPLAMSFVGTENTRWIDEIYRNSFSTAHSLQGQASVYGVPVMAGLSYSNRQGILLTDQMNGLRETLASIHPSCRITLF